MLTNKRQNIKEEIRLRSKIKKGLQKFVLESKKEHESQIAKILEEHKLRLVLRKLILEQAIIKEVEDPTTDIHDNTGINTLKELLKNSNILSSIRDVYMGITTEPQQRESFRAHIIQWVQDTLAPIRLNDTESLESAEINISEQALDDDDVGIDIEGVDAGKFLGGADIKDGSEKQDKKKDDDDDELTVISGKDTTGRNKAKRVYPNIEKSIIDYFAELDIPEDQEMFYDYLTANLKLYFDKWEGEMSTSVQEPESDAYDQATSDAAAESSI